MFSPTSSSEMQTISSSSLRYEIYLSHLLNTWHYLLETKLWTIHFTFSFTGHLYLQRTCSSCCIFRVILSISSLISSSSLFICFLLTWWRPSSRPLPWPSLAILFFFIPPGCLLSILQLRVSPIFSYSPPSCLLTVGHLKKITHRASTLFIHSLVVYK
jgi:hypothetical protein